jgi:hypothetical protein
MSNATFTLTIAKLNGDVLTRRMFRQLKYFDATTHAQTRAEVVALCKAVATVWDEGCHWVVMDTPNGIEKANEWYGRGLNALFGEAHPLPRIVLLK